MPSAEMERPGVTESKKSGGLGGKQLLVLGIIGGVALIVVVSIALVFLGSSGEEATPVESRGGKAEGENGPLVKSTPPIDPNPEPTATPEVTPEPSPTPEATPADPPPPPPPSPTTPTPDHRAPSADPGFDGSGSQGRRDAVPDGGQAAGGEG